eukprot:284972_1
MELPPEEIFAFGTWQSLSNHLAVADSVSGRWWTVIRESYSHPSRRYHNLSHIADMLVGMDNFNESLVYPHLVQLAIFFHDLIYDPRSNCNEVHSADRYKIFSQEIGQPHDERDAVVEYILATKDHPINRLGEYIDDNLKIVTDLDLAILGRQPDQYMDYAAHVRSEHACIGDKDYCRKRGAWLEKLLDPTKPIFASEQYQYQYEAIARHNILVELSLLRKGIIPGDVLPQSSVYVG